MSLYEILVPTTYQDTGKPVSVRHHREWDKYVRNISGGLTILKPAKGQWLCQGKVYEDRVIPVRLTCTAAQIQKICQFTLGHYRQLAVMAYKISDEVILLERKIDASVSGYSEANVRG